MDEEGLDWLGRNGGWVLLALGLLVLSLGLLFADHEALASVLGFSGVAVAVLGVLLSRLEGTFELSPTKLAGTLKRARQVATREDLTLEERGDALLHLLRVPSEPRSGGVDWSDWGDEPLSEQD